MADSHGLRFEADAFWVRYRRREYGPFDYEWAKDLCGVELTYRGRKFGEYCSVDEIFADLAEFRLPGPVARVATIVLGCTVYGLLNGQRPGERRDFLHDRLRAEGYEQFVAAE